MRKRAPITAASAAVALAIAFSACGGGERQDENEPEGSFAVEIAEAEFPGSQALAERTEMVIAVRNAGRETIPNVAVTVDDFARRSEQAGLADPDRPIWIVDSGPRGGTTAYVNTWALGRLAPGATKTFRWRVTAVRPGTHTLDYEVAAGLDGKAKARLAGGREPEGTFTVRVADDPPQARVDDDGKVVRSPER